MLSEDKKPEALSDSIAQAQASLAKLLDRQAAQTQAASEAEVLQATRRGRASAPPQALTDLQKLRVVPIEESDEESDDDFAAKSALYMTAVGKAGAGAVSYVEKKVGVRMMAQTASTLRALLESNSVCGGVSPGLVEEHKTAVMADLVSGLGSSKAQDSDDMLNAASTMSTKAGYISAAPRTRAGTGAPGGPPARPKNIMQDNIDVHISFMALQRAEQDVRHHVNLVGRCVKLVLPDPPTPAPAPATVKTERGG